MAQLKTKQVNGLVAALATKVETASNLGASGQGLFKQKSGTDLQFYKVGVAGSVVPDSPASDIVNLQLDIKNIATEVTTLEGTDRFAVMDDSASDATKYITKANLASELGGGAVSFGDYTADTSVGGDSIIFFDASDSNNPNIETKDNFLSLYAKLASPALTGTPTAPTAALGTSTTQLATTAFVQAALTSQAANFEFLSNVLGVQTDNTLDPGASPAAGDRYIITNAASLHANFGTINTDTEGNATTLANNDVVEYVGSAFYILFDASEEGEGAFTYNEADNKLWVYTTAWAALDTAEIIAGNGLAKSGVTLSVNVDDSTIEINSDTLRIKTTWVGQTSITTLGTITTGIWSATAIGVTKGGTGLTTVAANTLLGAQGSADTVVAIAVSASRFVGRKSSGNIVELTPGDAREVSQLRPVADSGTLTAGSMTLGTLSQTPLDASKVKIFINGLLLLYTTDYTISGTTVSATSALNVAYGGSSSDGNGFANDDVFQAAYTY